MTDWQFRNNSLDMVRLLAAAQVVVLHSLEFTMPRSVTDTLFFDLLRICFIRRIGNRNGIGLRVYFNFPDALFRIPYFIIYILSAAAALQAVVTSNTGFYNKGFFLFRCICIKK